MSTAGDIVQLGAELVVFIAAASLGLVVLSRPRDVGAGPFARVTLLVAAVAFGVVAGIAGATVDVDATGAGLTALRVTALVALGVGALAVDSSRARRLLLAGVVLAAAGEGLLHVGAEAAGNVSRGAGGVALGVTAALGARRSIAIRIAGAATVLLVTVVLLLSAVLSVVITGNVADEALQRTEERAEIEARIVEEQSDEAVGQADFLAQVLVNAGVFREAVESGEYGALTDAVEELRSDYRQVDFIAFVDSEGRARVAAGIEQGGAVEAAGTQVVQDALANVSASSVEVIGEGLVALGATPLSLPDERGVSEVVGSAVAGIRINQGFLAGRLQDQRGTEFALVTADQVISTTRDDPVESVAAAVGDELVDGVESSVLGRGRPASAETTVSGDEAFVAAHPVERSSGQPVAAFVVGTDTDLVQDTRTSLFRTLFLVALAALVAAFLVAVFAGARVAAPVRRLTDAARRVAEGDLTTRAGIDAEDEIGTLGAAFDSMTDSIELMTREIREAAAQTEAILGGMADGLVATDAQGRIVTLNPAAEEMLGRREARVLEQPVASVIKGTDARGAPLSKKLTAPMRRAWSTNGTLARRGSTLAVAMSVSPITDEGGEQIGRVYVMRDIQREAEVESMKSEFLANISHELRTPLTPIKGYAEMMLSKEVPAERREVFLSNILEGAQRLERYVDMLVNFSAMEAGRFELRTTEVRVGGLVEQVARRWRSRVGTHRVDTAISNRIPRVLADERLLERALNELMDNAVKYSPQGGTITLRARVRGSGAARHVELSVIDDGIGIEQADLEGIFSEFAQLDGSSTRRYGGLGLGLSFVHRVVGAHQGTLDAESSPGEGSTFTISLPPASRVKRPTKRRSRSSRTTRRATSEGARRTGRAKRSRSTRRTRRPKGSQRSTAQRSTAQRPTTSSNGRGSVGRAAGSRRGTAEARR